MAKYVDIFMPKNRKMDRVREVFGRPRSKATKVVEVEETLRSEYFQVAKTVRHGFPYQPTAMAFDRVQNLLAIGTKTGSLRLFGKPGVECHIEHDSETAVLQILFVGNQGCMVTVCEDDSVHLWDIRQRHPVIAHTLKFQRERITYGHHPFNSKWLYLGTEKGNIHIIKTEDFVLSGYVINWNKAIELTRKTHPGAVVHLSDNPADPNKLLIGFECGAIVLWDLRAKVAEARFNAPESMKSCFWHHEGKQFMSSHTDGSLAIWNIRTPLKPQNIIMPHAEIGKDGKPEPCRPITKVEWLSMRNDEPYIIFSGGMGYNQAGRSPSLTVMHGKNTTVLEMEHNVIDFISLASTPWSNDFQDPYGIIVLLQNDLVVVDLTSPGYPCFENPYPMDIHESPVTACQYIANCGTDLIPAFCSVGFKQKKSGFSPNEWPIKGGECYATTLSYSELIVTGHADGSLKFWDATAVTLQILYKLKTAKLFDKHKCHSPDREEEDQEDYEPFAIQHLYMCAESRLLVVAGQTHVILFKFNQKEACVECPTLEVSIVYEIYDELDSPGVEYPPIPPKLSGMRHQSSNASEGKQDKMTCVTTKASSRKWSPGYQPDLCILLNFIDGEPPPSITSLTVSSGHGLLAFGNDCGISVIDIIQKTCLLTMGTPDLYGSNDPYSRAPRSPKNKTQNRPQGLEGLSQNFAMDENKSPTQDQINGLCLSPTGHKACRPHPPELKRTKSQDKTDGSFSRSRSSSMSSLENVTGEAIQCLVFANAYTRKSDSYPCPSLWVGTVLGSVLVISISLPDKSDRTTQPVIVSPSGTIFRLKGAILAMSFLDCEGTLIPAVAEQWEGKSSEGRKVVPRQGSVSNMGKVRMSPTSSQELNSDRQLAILCSSRQARVISLPSQTCPFQAKITDTSEVTKAEVITVRDSVCLSCYVANGHIIILSLPSLKPLMDVDYLPHPNSTNVRIAKTFCFSNNGHALYFCSPTEVQKLTFSADTRLKVKDMLPELFKATETPEAPKPNFFKNLFAGRPATLDREELFGENSGKASMRVATYTPGTGQVLERATTSMSAIERAKMAALERGRNLSELEMRTEHMRSEAESFANASSELAKKYKNKKW